MKYKILAGATIFASLGAVFLWNSSWMQPDRFPSKTGYSASTLPPSKLASSNSPSSNESTKPMQMQMQIPNSPGYRLAARYNESKDRRAFFDEALAQPGAGGVFLAEKVVAECMANITPTTNNASTIQKHIGLIPKNAENYAARVQAVKQLLEPCLGFDTSPVRNLRAMLANIDVSKDPVLNLREKVSSALGKNGDLTELPAIIQKAKDAGTPYALMVTINQIAAASFNFNDYTISVDGKPVTIPETNALMFASSMVACQFGLDCSQNSRGVLEFCTSGRCAADVYALTQQYAVAPAEYELVLRFHNSMVAALQNGRFDTISVERKANRLQPG